MKKFFVVLFFTFLFFYSTFAEVVDDSISKELEKSETKPADSQTIDFQMKTYSSCEDIDSVINKYIDLYMKNHKRSNWWWDWVVPLASEKSYTSDASASMSSEKAPSWSRLSSNDFSKTNTQVAWVDESEIVKTDGKYIYYYSEKDDPRLSSTYSRERYIYILSLDRKSIVKKIKIPEKISSVEFYLSNGKLVVLWNIYSDNFFPKRNYYYNWQSTYVIVYDVSNLEKLKLEKFYTIDWRYSESRLIWDKLYVISWNDFHFPYWNLRSEKFSVLGSIPKKIDVNLNSSNKYSVKQSFSWDCRNIEFILPDEKYFSEQSFSLDYNIVSVIDIKNPSKEVQTKIIASNSQNIFMSEKNLYLTSHMYYSKPFSCIWIDCVFSSYDSKENTLVNKFWLTDWIIKYKKSALLDWRPLTQYSMDEDKDWNFRILTQKESWSNNQETYTNLYVLNPDLKLVWKLQELGKKEQFKASRYIWDKLFLVTFERTDPLFVIDLKDSKNPKVLWELKIPWYSTYLHPYDENHLIWLGYDTKENKWWWIQNSGVKLDLYQINYNKKCYDKNLTEEESKKCASWEYKGIIAKQLYTKTFGWSTSNSEALHNPRMFMWNSAKNKLFLPITIGDSSYDEDGNKQGNKEYFSGLVALTINKNTWIKEDFRTTNIDLKKAESDRMEECKKYDLSWEKTCKKLVSWKEVCGYVNLSDIPNYCMSDSSVWEYLSEKSYNFSNSTINRALWIWENFYSLSPNKIKANNINTWKEVLDVSLD